MKQKLQLLKLAINEPEILNEIPKEILDALELEYIRYYKVQAELTTPSLKSVGEAMWEDAEDKPAVQNLLKQISSQSELDLAQRDLALIQCNQEAMRKILQKISLPETPVKDMIAGNERILELQQSQDRKFERPVSATNWEALKKSDLDCINLMINWFKDNDVPIKKKVLYSFIATTNGGKTIIKTWFASELIKVGANVLYLAQEEPYSDTIRRIHQSTLGLTEVEYHKQTEEGFDKVGKDYNYISNLKGYGEFHVAEWTGIKIAAIKTYIKEHNKTNPNIDAVIIDYGKLVETSSDKKNAEEWIRIGLIFAELKQLAMKENIAVITSIQLNRAASDKLLKNGKTPELTDVAGAFEATHHVNYAWAVRLSPTKGDVDFKNPDQILGTYHLTVLKQKYGRLRHGDRAQFQWNTCHDLQEVGNLSEGTREVLES